MQAIMGQSSLSGERNTTEPDTEMAMSRIILISSFAGLLAACGTQSSSDVRSANQGTWAQEGLACADVGIAPGSGAFSRCVSDLHNSLWAEQNLEQN
jgi:hypothetical protein